MSIRETVDEALADFVGVDQLHSLAVVRALAHHLTREIGLVLRALSVEIPQFFSYSVKQSVIIQEQFVHPRRHLPLLVLRTVQQLQITRRGVCCVLCDRLALRRLVRGVS
jgi:hypothetical protein